MPSNSLEAINRRGAILLGALARDPRNDTIATEFDTFFYPFLLAYVRKRHGSLPATVDPQDLQEAAHATAWLTLQRTRASARRFDPDKGTATAWILRSAAWAYKEVAKELARGSRRSVLQVLMESDMLQRRINELRQEDDPADIVIGQATVNAAFSLLSVQEQHAYVLKEQGHSHAESAEIMFGDGTQHRRVEHLLRRARRKVGAAWNELHATGAAAGLDSEATKDDKEPG